MTFELQRQGVVRLQALDILGRSVQIILNEYRSAGTHSLSWEPGTLPSGTYFLALTSGASMSVVRCQLIR